MATAMKFNGELSCVMISQQPNTNSISVEAIVVMLVSLSFWLF